MGNCSNVCSVTNKQYKYDTDNFNKILTEDLKELPQENSLNITTQANTNKSLIDKSQQQGQSIDAGLFSKLLNDKLESRNCSFLQQQPKKEINKEILNSLKFSVEIQDLLSLYFVNNILVHESQLSLQITDNDTSQNKLIEELLQKDFINYKQILIQQNSNQENTLNVQSQQKASQFQIDLTKLIQFQNQAKQNCQQEVNLNQQLETSIDKDCQIQILKVKPSLKNDSLIQQMNHQIEKKQVSLQQQKSVANAKVLQRNESKSRLNKKNENILSKNANKINLPEYQIGNKNKEKSPNLLKNKLEKKKSTQTLCKQSNKENKISCNQTPIKKSNQKVRQPKSILKKSSIKSFQNTPNLYDITPPGETNHEIVNFVTEEEEQKPLKVFMTLEQLLVDNTKLVKPEYQESDTEQEEAPIQVKMDLQQLFQQPSIQQVQLFQSNNNSIDNNNVTFFQQTHCFKK